jgi:hypothetical protein
MTSETGAQFAHRVNRDGTVDSVCMECFAAVASARRESDLEKPQQEHVCDPAVLETYRRATHQA